ncbi:MAG: MFS transporter [Saccharofermentanales bacterium]
MTRSIKIKSVFLNLNSKNFKFSILQSVYWSAFCVLFGFIVPMFKDLGYTKFEIGILTMLIALSSMISQPLIGLICDKKGNIKNLFIIMMVLSCIFILFLPQSSKTLLFAAFIIMLLSVTFQSMASIIDSWAIRLKNNGENIDYSLTRSFGAMSCSFVAIIFGVMLDKYGIWIRIPVFIFLISVVIFVAFTIKSPKRAVIILDEEKSVNTFTLLYQNKRYRDFLIATILIFIGYGSTNVFFPILLNQLGGKNSDLGVGFFIMSISQALMMILFGILAKKTNNNIDILLVISMLFFAVKGILVAISPNIGWALIVQILEAVSYGLFLPSAVGYINKIVDNKMIITAQTLFAATSFGLGATIGNFAGGVLSEIFDVKIMMLILNSIALAGALLFIYFLRESKRKKVFEI